MNRKSMIPPTAVCLALVTQSPTSSAAAIINNDFNTTIRDNGSDNSGDGTLPNSNQRFVGDSSNDSTLFAPVYRFDISDDAADIAAAVQIFSKSI